MMMVNSSQGSYFTLTAYLHSGHLKYFFFTLVVFLYAVIVGANVLLLVVISVNRSLHEPMYMFVCSLFVNELYGSTGLFPFLLLQILSDVHTVPAALCFLQLFCLYTYANLQLNNLAIMSYDRYLAICCPLHYHTRMSCSTVSMLIALTWLYSFLGVTLLISLSAPLQLCGNIINKVYCDNYSIVKLACSDTTANSIYGVLGALFITTSSVSLILYTYVRILRVCFSGSTQTRHKAVSTCTPHLAALFNFSCGSFFEIAQSRFNMKHVPNMLRTVLSLYWLMCPPLCNPLLYGLNLTKVRLICKNLIFVKCKCLMLKLGAGSALVKRK